MSLADIKRDMIRRERRKNRTTTIKPKCESAYSRNIVVKPKRKNV